MARNAILFVGTGSATLFFQVERRTEIKDWPGFPAHATDYVFVDGEKVAMIYTVGGVEYVSRIDSYHTHATTRAQEVARALHSQCAHYRTDRRSASWLKAVN